jgi:hypothetical protein
MGMQATKFKRVCRRALCLLRKRLISKGDKVEEASRLFAPAHQCPRRPVRQSRRDCITQPRVGPIPRGLPWVTPFKFHNPERVEYQVLMKKIQPFQGRECYGFSPRVARSPAFATLRRGKSQHRCWAKRFNPFGIGNAHGHSAKITQAETVLYQVVMVYSSRPAENSCKFILTFARQRLR